MFFTNHVNEIHNQNYHDGLDAMFFIFIFLILQFRVWTGYLHYFNFLGYVVWLWLFHGCYGLNCVPPEIPMLKP